MLYLIIPISIFSLLGFLPERYFEPIIKRFQVVKRSFLRHFGGDGESFMSYLSSYFYSQNGSQDIPKYKFYTALILKLNHYGRLFGAPKKEMIDSLKKGVFEDFKFERKLKAVYLNFLSQAFAMTVMTWGFIYLVRKLMKVEVEPFQILLIVILQTLGPIVFSAAYLRLKLRMFKGYEIFFSSLYTMKVLSSVGVAATDLVKEAEIEGLAEFAKKDKRAVYMRVLEIISRLKQMGGPIRDDLDQLVSELWFLQEQSFEKFVKQTTALRFMVLALFYLSSYFIFVLGIFSGLI